MNFNCLKFEERVFESLDMELKDSINSLFIYGSNVFSFNNNTKLISNEIDLLFVMKVANSIRNSDVDRSKFSFFINSLQSYYNNIEFVFNGELPPNMNSNNIYIDIITDNVSSIKRVTPTSTVSAILPKKLIFGTNIYNKISVKKISKEDFVFLVNQKIDYLSRVYCNRNDLIAKRACAKGLLFLLSWIYNEELKKFITFDIDSYSRYFDRVYLQMIDLQKSNSLFSLDIKVSFQHMNKLLSIASEGK